MTLIESCDSLLAVGDERYNLSIGDVVEITGLHPNTIRDYTAKGRLNCRVLPSGHRRFRRSDVEQLLREPDVAASGTATD